MATRSAVDTIRGYYYQFDLSILSILQLESLDDSVEIECVEDVDIRTATDVTATQCKYYAKTEYNHSVIKDAVKHMLSHFKEALLGVKPKVRYSIKGHYASGQEKLDGGIDLNFLKKNFLTYDKDNITYCHHIDLGLSDSELLEFLRHLSVDVRAKGFDEQFREVLAHLQTIFGGTPFAAEYFYYNNALAVIRDLSIKPAPTERSITKREFLSRIDTSTILFNEWFVEKKGKNAYLAKLRKEYFSELNLSPFERFFLIETDAGSYARADVKDIIFEISRKWSKLSSRDPSPFCPYIYVHGIADGELIALKREFSLEGFKFIDGHDFQGAEFNFRSITQKANYGNGIRVKILNTLEQLEETLDSVTKTRRLYQFHLGNTYFTYDNPAVRHVKIQIDRLADVISII